MDATGKGGLTRAQILGALDLVMEAVDVPEWGGTVYVRNMSGKARDSFEASRYRFGPQNKLEMVADNTRANLLSKTICDAEGHLEFMPEDIELLGDKNASVLDRLFEVAQRINGLLPKDVEEKLKNFGAALSVNSSSVLPSH